jgi:hypothetical protein
LGSEHLVGRRQPALRAERLAQLELADLVVAAQEHHDLAAGV